MYIINEAGQNKKNDPAFFIKSYHYIKDLKFMFLAGHSRYARNGVASQRRWYYELLQGESRPKTGLAVL